MGAAGDMLMSALLELCDDPDYSLRRLNSLGIPSVKISAEKSMKCGITGTHTTVNIGGETEDFQLQTHKHTHEHNHTHEHTHKHTENHSHSHNNLHSIEHSIAFLNISQEVRDNALNVYKILAEAESYVHNTTVDKIHFHEVGELDAIADIVGVCTLLDEIKPDKIFASPVNVGSGQVHCAHGILPVPAPATARILQGVPVYGNDIKGELCTPTGAALLKYFVSEFIPLPQMSISKVGYGMGFKDFESANCVRAILGETADITDNITELVCNIDDMTPEHISFAVELLFEQGALDVFTTPIYMKKNRSAVKLSCICKNAQKEEMIKLLFRHTSTFGIREYDCKRYILNREIKSVSIPLGDIHIKTGQGYGVKKSKFEYEDIAEIAKREDMPIEKVLKVLSEVDFLDKEL
jgi:uncharacterized protein (TIGR00299 family) protein